jgi:pyrroloquinoline-quinone synthase
VDFFTSLDELIERRSVLRHPFYTRWSAGELTIEELADYSGQYRHAVTALAAASARAAELADDEQTRAELEGHAAEELAHVELWDSFMAAVGGGGDDRPTPESEHCAATWAGARDRELLPTLVALYVIESSQPAIAATKRQGLAEHYAITGKGASYFELHEQRDVEHARAARELIEARLDVSDQQPLLAEAERVLDANWLLLDGVERLAA